MKILNNILLYIKVYSSRIWDSFWYAQYITIYRTFKQNKIFRIDITFPDINFYSFKSLNKIFETNESDKRGIRFPTEIWLENNDDHYSLNIKLLGFGVSIKKYEKIT